METEDGIILLDMPSEEKFDLDQFRKSFADLGLSIENIKIIFVDAEREKYKKADLLRKHSGGKILMGKVDVEVAKEEREEHYRPDELLQEGDIFRLGQYEIKCFATEGCETVKISFILNVYDEGKKHTASLFRANFNEDAPIDECDQYIKEAIRFSLISSEHDVDVILQTRPYMINGKEKYEIIRNIYSEGVCNPFVIGRDGCQMFEKHLINHAVTIRNEKMKKEN